MALSSMACCRPASQKLGVLESKVVPQSFKLSKRRMVLSCCLPAQSQASSSPSPDVGRISGIPGISEKNVVESVEAEKEYAFLETPTSRGIGGGVPVYVMLPLDSVNVNNTLNRRRALNAGLVALKSAGVEGVMVDFWWGIVERDKPNQYKWSAYKELVGLVQKNRLRVQAVMSFHQCGGNVGDSCYIPLPLWVVEEINRNPELVYTDKAGNRNHEYLSLGCDLLPVLRGRSPIQAYTDFLRSFRDTFKDVLGETIVEVQVGLGPAGELRYPAYPENNGKWRFPGIGEFQCYDEYMMCSLRACAAACGSTEWGESGPHDAGHYNQWPDETGFFSRDGSWNSPYGNFFLEWYSGMLVMHGERILCAAEGVLRGTGVRLAGKVAGVHWHYGTRSHPAELTAGYYNTRGRDGYAEVARMFGRHGAAIIFTCIEMRDCEQPTQALSSPESLFEQVACACRKAGVALAGENALPRYDEAAYEQVVRKSRMMMQQQEENECRRRMEWDDDDDECSATEAPQCEPMCSFTFLRMSERLFYNENWHSFVPFVRRMAAGGRNGAFYEHEHHHDTESHMHATRPLVQEAAASLMCH